MPICRRPVIQPIKALDFVKSNFIGFQYSGSKMAGENEGKDTLEFSNSNTTCNLNLTRLRERVKDYIDKVVESGKCLHLCPPLIRTVSTNKL